MARHTCPSCHQPIPDNVPDECPRCGTDLLDRYGAPVRSLREVIRRLSSGEVPMSTDRIGNLMAHVTGIAQQVLDSAREDLETNMRALAAARHGLGEASAGQGDLLACVGEFENTQVLVNESLRQVADVLSSARTPQELAQKQHVLDYATGRLQDASARLGRLVGRTASPALLVDPGPPFAPGAMEAMDSLRQATDAFGRYIQGRGADALEETLRHLERAQEDIKRILEAGTK